MVQVPVDFALQICGLKPSPFKLTRYSLSGWFSPLTHSLYNPQQGAVILKTTRRNCLYAFAFALLTLIFVAEARAQQLSPKLQDAIGHWQVLDSNGRPGGKVETYLKDGMLFGRVTELRPGHSPRDLCEKCSGEFSNKLILGMVLMRDFHPNGADWAEGTVVDPESGKQYQGKIWAVGTGSLHLRGFVGISLLGRTESWIRIP